MCFYAFSLGLSRWRVRSRKVFFSILFCSSSVRSMSVWLARQSSTHSTSAISSPRASCPLSLARGGRFPRLFPVAATDYARQFANLLGEHRHIGQFREVAHAVFLDPAIYRFLCFLDCHIPVYFSTARSGVVLFFILRVHADGDGSVVEQFHLHVGPEFTCSDRFSQCLTHFSAKFFV